MENMPMIFQTSTLTYDERFPVYSNEILGKCKASEVTSKFANYVEKMVKKRGWKASWSSVDVDVNTKEHLNILVEVINVFPQRLSSEVNICVPIQSNPPITFQEAQLLIRERDNCIPLTELLPVFDESGDFDETALALEHVRFFFHNLWRDWDLEAEDDYCYVDRYLGSRLQLYYGITQNKLPKEFIKRYETKLNEYKQKVAHLKELRKNMSASDSEEELDTSDVFILAQKNHELDDIVSSLKTMEDPQMRCLLACVKRPSEITEARTYPVTMIIAEKLTAKMTKSLTDETIIEHFKSLQRAVECSCADDCVEIYPGRYSVGALVFKESLSLTGHGNVTVQCEEENDSFLTTRSQSIAFQNIALVDTSAAKSALLVVEKGRTLLRNCELRCKTDGILVKRAAELRMENCKIYGSMNVAVTVEEDSVACIERCEILNKDTSKKTTGIKIVSNTANPAKVDITDSRIVATYGVTITDGHDSRTVQEPMGDGVRLKLENNIFECEAVS